MKLGKIKADEISECFSDLSDSDIKELEAEVMNWNKEYNICMEQVTLRLQMYFSGRDIWSEKAVV